MQGGAGAQNGIREKNNKSGGTHPHREVFHFKIREQGQMYALAEFWKIAGGGNDTKQEVCADESG